MNQDIGGGNIKDEAERAKRKLIDDLQKMTTFDENVEELSG